MTGVTVRSFMPEEIDLEGFDELQGVDDCQPVGNGAEETPGHQRDEVARGDDFWNEQE